MQVEGVGSGKWPNLSKSWAIDRGGKQISQFWLPHFFTEKKYVLWWQQWVKYWVSFGLLRKSPTQSKGVIDLSRFKDLNSSSISLCDASSGTRNGTHFNCRQENWSLISWVQGLHDSSSNFRFFYGLLCTSLQFNLCSNSWSMEGFLIMPIPYSLRFNMQLIFSTGLRYEWPGAVLATNMWSRLRNFCKAIISILTLRNVVPCSRPLSLYIIRAGGICSMEPYFAIKISATSRVLLKAEEGMMAVIFNKTFGSPQYHESSMLSLIWLIKIMVEINDKFKNSWSATWKT